MTVKATPQFIIKQNKRRMYKKVKRIVRRNPWCKAWPNCACIVRGRESDCQKIILKEVVNG